MKSVVTTCAYCGCGCNFFVDTEEESIVGIRPKADHPVSRGMLCAKGMLGHGFVRHKDRLRSPKIRQNDGTFKDVSWDEALTHVTQKLRHIAATKPDSFALFSSARCTNEENYLATKLCRAVMHSPHIDHCARL